MVFRVLILVLLLMVTIKSTVAFSMENSSNTLNEPEVFVHYVIFFEKQNKEFSSDELVAQCDTRGIEIIEDLDSSIDKPSLMVKKQGVDQLPVPSLESLQYFGRGFDQSKANRIMKSDYSVSFIGFSPFDKENMLLKKITKCVGGIAVKYDGFVLDVADSLTFTSDAFAKIRVNEIIEGVFSSSQFGVRAYRVGKGIRSVSMGLEKFGQPNLAIENFAEHHMGYMDKLFTMILQQVIESPNKVTPGPIIIDISSFDNPVVRKNLNESIRPGGAGKVKLVLKKTAPLDGDPSELLAITFENAPGDNLWDEQAILLRSVFGRDRDVSNVSSSVSLEAAIESARMRAKQILGEGHTIEKDGMRLIVAVALEETREVVWVEVMEWKDPNGVGILLSNPNHTKNLSSGMKYKFNYASVMDFKLYGPDGIVEQGGVDELARQAGSEQ